MESSLVILGLLVASLVLACVSLCFATYVFVTARKQNLERAKKEAEIEAQYTGQLSGDDSKVERTARLRKFNESFFETQYTQCYELLRHHDRIILQAPSIAIVVDGAVIVSAFAFIQSWWVREFILASVLALTIGFVNILTKTLYHIRIEKQTLTCMEARVAEAVVQRTTKPENVTKYWYYRKPGYLERRSVAKFFIGSMWFIVGLIVLLMILNPLFLAVSHN